MLKDDKNVGEDFGETAETAAKHADAAAAFALPPIPSRKHQLLDHGSRLAIYIAGSRATEQFLKNMGVTGYQIGVTGRREVELRIADKRLRGYGSILADPLNPSANAFELPLGRDVFLIRIDETMLQGVQVPAGLTINNGVIEFMVRPKVTVEQVDKLISRALKDRCLNRYLSTEDGRRRMCDAGYHPRQRVMTRYTDIGREPRLSLAEEIFLFRPRKELQGLLNLIAKTLADILVR